jgi:hypothetical protein
MGFFRIWLIFVFLIVSVYTASVVSLYGLNLFPYFFGDMMKMGWAGQFNLDFMFMLAFSAMWMAWRNEFAPQGLGLAVLAFFFGAPFLCLYLFYLSRQTNGDVVKMLIGNRATA